MARRKENIVYHNMRMNLDNEQHRRIHMILTDLNTNVHKSVNQFLIDATDYYIKKLEGNELTNENMSQVKENIYITQEDLDKVKREIRDELQREMIIILGSAFTSGKAISLSEIRSDRELETQSVTKEEVNADGTTIGLVSTWG